MASGPELLVELMGFGHFVEMAMTRDGFLIARLHGEAGFDAFLGSVTAAMRERTARLWLELDAEDQSLVLSRLAIQHIAPQRIGIEPDVICNSNRIIRMTASPAPAPAPVTRHSR